MEFAFQSKELRTLCENEGAAIDALGATVATALRHRLADLRAATNVGDLIAGSPRILQETNQMVIDLDDKYWLIFQPNVRKRSPPGQGRTDWNKVSRLMLIKVDRRNE